MIDIEAEQAFATECIAREAKTEGIVVGRTEGEIIAYIKLYKNRLIKSKDAAKMLNITESEFLEKVKTLA